MKKLIERDKYRRNLVSNFEVKRIILKSIVRNNNLDRKIRWSAQLNLSDIFVDSARARVVNRCILTGRKAKVRESYKFSRLSFLRLARNGLISGLKKSSW
jgi:small subunit ribosomal protein S14